MNRVLIRLLPLLLSGYTIAIHGYGQTETYTIRADQPRQELLGFGGSQVYYLENWLEHPSPDLLFELLFDDLGVDILRLEMAYERPNSSSSWQGRMDDQQQLLAEAQARGVTTTMITSWSPPPYLKSNGTVLGGTLAQDPQGNYRYADYADWWIEGLLEYQSRGMTFDWVSPQNEPIWDDNYPTCLFEPLEDPLIAGYREMLVAFKSRLDLEPSLTPSVMACESAGYWDLWAYVDELDDLPWIDAFSHHMYGVNWNNPDEAIPAMVTLQTVHGDRTLFQTEYSSLLAPLGFNDTLFQARHIHNVLVYEQAASYLVWGLLWEQGLGELDGIVLVEDPALQDPSIQVTDAYWGLKHYSYFLGPGDVRLHVEEPANPSLSVSAYQRAADNSVIVVLINATQSPIPMELEFEQFTPGPSVAWRTRVNQPFQPQGSYSPLGMRMLAANSLTTIEIQDGSQACLISSFCGAAVQGSTPPHISALGSSSVQANDLSFQIENLPGGQFGLVFFGQGFTTAPMGNGTRCIAPPLYRLPAVPTSPAGLALSSFDNTSTQASIVQGTTWSFQFWYRDPASGGAMNSVSDGVSLVFCP